MSEKPNTNKMIHDLLGMLKNPPSDGVMTTAYSVYQHLQSYADDGAVDSGFGFGESHLDFWLDDKAIRVVVKAVPALDREPTQ